MGDLTYPKAMASYTFREGYDYKKYLEDQSHLTYLASSIDQSIANLALSNVEIARLSTEAIVDSQQQASRQISQELDSISVGIEKLDDSINDLRLTVEDVRWAVDEVRYAVESGFQVSTQYLGAIEDILQDLLETVKSPEKTWALEKYDIANELYRRELYADALSYLNDALHGHGEHRGYIFDPRVYILKGSILLGDAENFEPDLIDIPAAKECFEEAVKFAKLPRDMIVGVDETKREELIQPRVFARCCSAWASYVQGNIKEAELEYREAVKEGPNNARAHYYLGKVLAHQGRYQEAEEALDKAIRENFFYVAKLASDSDYLKERKRFEKCVANYRIELLEVLEPFANILCLLRGEKAANLYPGNRKFDNIQTLDVAHAISSKTAEIGPMVSNFDQLKHDAFQAKELIEEVVQNTERQVHYKKDSKNNISRPSSSEVEYFDSDKIVRKQRIVG